MKIAVITADRKQGGLLLAFVNYVDCLGALGHEVTVIVPRGAEYLRAALEDRFGARFAVHLLSAADIEIVRRLGVAPPALGDLLRGQDAVLSHNSFLCRALSRSRVPLITVCHSDKWKGTARADAVVFLSDIAADRFVQDPKRPETIEHRRGQRFVLPNYYVAAPGPNPYPSKPADPFVVSAAGRFVRNKGFRDFIGAASRLRGEGRDIRFLLAGQGEDEKALRALSQAAGAEVEFLGWTDIDALAARSHVFCLTSEEEPFGFVLCEMMDRGVPCISTVTNGPWDILDHGEAGLIYPMGDADALAEAIRELYLSPKRRLEMSNKAFDRIRAPAFSKAVFTERLQQVIDQVTHSAHPRESGEPRVS
jgi:glycosyltransferase involved in cell wall biosynthesis